MDADRQPIGISRAARALIGACGVMAGLCFWAGPAGAVSLSNSQPIIRHALAPGEAVQGSIELLNNGDQPLRVSAYLEDWEYSPAGDGSKEFAPPGSLPRSCAPWLSFFPRQIDVPAYGRAVVDYTVRIPQDEPLDGGYYAVLFFESAIGEGPSPEEESVTVTYAARLGSLFLVEVAGTSRREARLSSVSVSPPSASGTMPIAAVLANEGNVSLNCEGTFHIMAPTNLVVGRGELPHRYLWPGRQASVDAEWAGALPSGRSTVVLTYDCGEELVVVEEAGVAVP